MTRRWVTWLAQSSCGFVDRKLNYQYRATSKSMTFTIYFFCIILFLQVGQAGKRLFQFFERRWEELAPNMDWGSGGRYEFSFSFLVFQHACSTVVCGRILSARKFWTRHLGFGFCGGMGWGKICRGSRRAPFLYRLSIQSKMAASKTACTASYPSHQRPNFLSHLNFPFWLTCLFFFSH